jgi:hypothetical protein
MGCVVDVGEVDEGGCWIVGKVSNGLMLRDFGQLDGSEAGSGGLRPTPRTSSTPWIHFQHSQSAMATALGRPRS